MQLWFWFVIALAPTAALGILLWKSLKLNSLTMESTLEIQSRNLSLMAANQQRYLEANQTLTNLLLSKDSIAFQQIQAMTNQSRSQEVEAVNPLDDASVAQTLMEQYARHGLDPMSALSQDDLAEVRTEFGL